MGKSKTRILRKGINNQFTRMTRDGAVIETVKLLNKNYTNDAKDLITMFGLTAEEILEAGASYESVKAIQNIFTEL
jgi:hypothetical protein